MLIFKLSRILDLRGVDKPHAYLTRLGFSRQAASRLINDNAALISIEYLETLCAALHCTPNDLFEWRADANDETAEHHPLKTLVRDKPAAHISQIVKDIPLEKMARVEEMLKQVRDE